MFYLLIYCYAQVDFLFVFQVLLIISRSIEWIVPLQNTFLTQGLQWEVINYSNVIDCVGGIASSSVLCSSNDSTRGVCGTLFQYEYRESAEVYGGQIYLQ